MSDDSNKPRCILRVEKTTGLKAVVSPEDPKCWNLLSPTGVTLFRMSGDEFLGSLKFPDMRDIEGSRMIAVLENNGSEEVFCSGPFEDVKCANEACGRMQRHANEGFTYRVAKICITDFDSMSFYERR
jgi:hypothetical protein